jgi:hypothetical protein
MVAGSASNAALVAAQQLRKVALVLGNSNYNKVQHLPNPDHDADLIATKLIKVGFQVAGGGAQKDLSRSSFLNLIQQFSSEAASADVAVVYYAGHGVQVNGANFLVPTDANPKSITDVASQLVDAQSVLDALNKANIKLKILILDACRDNPFVTRGLFSSGLADVPRGLATMSVPRGTVIWYATQPGSVASDGSGGNGPFALAISHNIDVPGLDVYGVFNRTGNEVTKNYPDQQPWLAASALDGTFYFVSSPDGQTRSLFAVPASIDDPEKRIKKIFSSGIKTPTRNFAFGDSFRAVNGNLDSPFGIVSYETLPRATEFDPRMIRYLWVPLSSLPVVASAILPQEGSGGHCMDPQSYIVFLFEDEKLFSISIRLYKSQTCTSYGWLVTGLFSSEHRAALIHSGMGDTSVSAHEGAQYTVIDITQTGTQKIWLD